MYVHMSRQLHNFYNNMKIRIYEENKEYYEEPSAADPFLAERSPSPYQINCLLDEEESLVAKTFLAERSPSPYQINCLLNEEETVASRIKKFYKTGAYKIKDIGIYEENERHKFKMPKIISFFKKIWEALKRFGKWLATKILSFAKNIRDFFLHRRELLRKRKELLAISIKERLENGNIGVVNCLYDTNTEDIYNMEAQDIEAEQLDNETIRNFGGKEMIVLQ